MLDYRVFVQARMSSTRFPGKMLAPLLGVPLIARVLRRLEECIERERIVLLTSDESSDDPLAHYVSENLGYQVFRGSLDNVVQRFQSALQEYPAKWFVRICGDSPVIDPALLKWMLTNLDQNVDVATNVRLRTFPPGQSIEIVCSDRFLELDTTSLTMHEIEHPTLYLYRRNGNVRMQDIRSTAADLGSQSYVVDSLEDLVNIESVLKNFSELTRGFDKVAYDAGECFGGYA